MADFASRGHGAVDFERGGRMITGMIEHPLKPADVLDGGDPDFVFMNCCYLGRSIQ
jgi:hypothetical protein